MTYRMKKRQAKAGAAVDRRKGWRMDDLLVLSHIKMRGSSYMLLHNRVTRRNNVNYNDEITNVHALHMHGISSILIIVLHYIPFFKK